MFHWPRLFSSFFYGKDKANERSSHLMASDYRHTKGTSGALPAFKVEIDALFEGTHVIWTWKHCSVRPFHSSVARGRKLSTL